MPLESCGCSSSLDEGWQLISLKRSREGKGSGKRLNASL